MRLHPPDGHFESLQGQLGVNAAGESVAHHLLCTQVFYRCQVQSALVVGDVADVSHITLFSNFS